MSDQQKQRNWFARHKILTGFLIIIILGVVIGAAGDSNSTNNTNNETKNTAEAPKPTRWNPEDYYDKIATGQTKADVEQLLGKTSDTCTTTEAAGMVMEACNYGGGLTDKGLIIVTYSDGKVYSKTKSNY